MANNNSNNNIAGRLMGNGRNGETKDSTTIVEREGNL